MEIIPMNSDPDPLFNSDTHKASIRNEIHTAVGCHSYQNLIQHNSWVI